MPTIDATVGGSDSNSYTTVSVGDTYFDERLQASNWTGESDSDVKSRALIMATRRIDRFRFKGYKNSTSQALKFPRDYIYDEDGEVYSTTAIPQPVIDATLELALDILNQNADSKDPFADDGLERYDRAKVGPLEVEVNHGSRSTDVPDHVRGLLSHLLLSLGMMAELERA